MWAFQKVLRREVQEEVSLEIANIRYVTSLATVHGDGNPSLVISCLTDYQTGDVQLKIDETDAFVWVTLEEAKNYQLIDGIYDELVMAENLLKGISQEWQKAS
jgi:NADH pyrophosphatase NudC (nudix superfamily)